MEQGTHAELMARDGLYRHLNEVQTQVERKWARAELVTPQAVPAHSGNGGNGHNMRAGEPNA